MEKFFAWCDAHPTLTVVLVVPVLMGILNWVLAPSTYEQYLVFEKKHPRLAAVMQIARALGVDPFKLAAWVRTLLTNRLPPAGPMGPSGGGGSPMAEKLRENHRSPIDTTLKSTILPPPYSRVEMSGRRAGWVLALFATFAISFTAGLLPSCALFREGSTPGERQQAFLSLEQTTCLLASGFADDSPQVRALCKIADALAPFVAQLFSAQRAGLARAGLRRSGLEADAGLPEVGPYRDAYQ